jgi:hypothetical protein
MPLQLRPESHVDPAQQGSPLPPQFRHVVMTSHTSAAVSQLVPPQHGSPLPPQLRHVPVTHVVPVLQVLPAQHGLPVVPHAVHVALPPHIRPAPQGVVEAQQRSPLCPQFPHVLVSHIKVPVQVPPAQHGALIAPHATQCMVASQTLPVLHIEPAQHAWPPPPHAAQCMVASHALPVLHVPPAQHACPPPPHATQCPPVDASHTRLGSPHEVPQQSAPAVPHASQRPVLAQVAPLAQVEVSPQHGVPI